MKLKMQLNRSREIKPSYDERKQFIDKFFSFSGLPEYYSQLAQQTGEQQDREAAEILSQPGDKYIPLLMKYYNCDPSWPICLYDFTHRNLNPKYNNFKVAAPLNTIVRENYFTSEKLSRRVAQADGELLDQRLNTVGDELLVQRSIHLCTQAPDF